MMQKLAAVLVYLSVSCGLAFGFMENRTDWWRARLEKLGKEKARIEHLDSIDRGVLSLIDREISEARKMIAVLEEGTDDQSRLSSESRSYSEAEIADLREKLLPPVFALYYLRNFSEGFRAPEQRQEAGDAVSAALDRAITERLGGQDADLKTMILKKSITHEEWRNISPEVFTLRVRASVSAVRDKAWSGLSKKLADGLAGRERKFNDTQVRKEIIRIGTDHLRSFNYAEALVPAGDVLKESPAWARTLKRLSAGLSLCEQVRKMAKVGGMTPVKAWQITQRPAEMDALLFREGRDKYLLKKMVTPDKGSAVSPDRYYIPDNPDCAAALDQMDASRISTAVSLRGGEGAVFFRDLEEGLDRIILRHTQTVRDSFEKEEGRLGRVDENSGGRGTNAAEFRLAKHVFKKKIELLNEYKRKNLEYLKTLSRTLGSRGDVISDYYQGLARLAAKTLEFVKGLNRDISRMPAAGSGMLKEWGTVMKKLEPVYGYFHDALALRKSDHAGLEKESILELRELQGAYVSELKAMRQEAGSLYSASLSRDKTQARRSIEQRSVLEERIAQNELHIVHDLFRQCAGLYQGYRYAEEAFYSYGESYNRLRSEAAEGRISPELEKAMKAGSLFVSVPGFSRERIQREKAARAYLANELKAAYARLSYLVNYYKSRKVRIKDNPLTEDGALLNSLSRKASSVRVASWSMNEANFDEVDRNAVQSLRLLVRHRRWQERGSSAKGNAAGTGREVRLEEPGFSVYLADRWKERSPGEEERARGVVRAFGGDDGMSLVLAILDGSGDDARKSAARWLSRQGHRLSREKTGTQAGIEYYWALASDRERNVVEVYVMTVKDRIVIVSGRSPKAFYAGFHERLAAVMKSLKI